ncbi:MAG TPA: polyhydroxyalkanoic acid system family protein [Oxalicibacterium sp.]|jgi:putative polyhydroxyalkanoate system protein|nr:polyhydroxyalkanoic acid system family protein [Oxalicibacterium sp.]
MADIEMTQAHALSPQQARDAAQQVASRMAEEYEMQTRWEGDVLHFGRAGLEGQLALQPQQVHLAIELSGFFKSFAGMIEDKIRRHIGKTFGAA